MCSNVLLNEFWVRVLYVYTFIPFPKLFLSKNFMASRNASGDPEGRLMTWTKISEACSRENVQETSVSEAILKRYMFSSFLFNYQSNI